MGQRRYNTTATTLAPGLRAEIRSFPYRYIGPAPDEQMQDALFVRDSSGLLHYLTSTE